MRRLRTVAAAFFIPNSSGFFLSRVCVPAVHLPASSPKVFFFGDRFFATPRLWCLKNLIPARTTCVVASGVAYGRLYSPFFSFSLSLSLSLSLYFFRDINLDRFIRDGWARVFGVNTLQTRGNTAGERLPL